MATKGTRIDLRGVRIDSAVDARGQVIRVGALVHPYYGGEACALTTLRVVSIKQVYDYAHTPPRFLRISVSTIDRLASGDAGRASYVPSELVVCDA